jgi:hypothetical protein
MAEDTLQAGDCKKQKDMGSEPHWKPEKANPRLDQLEKPISGINRASFLDSSRSMTLGVTSEFLDPLFDQDFDDFMESLNNLEPFDDLEDWTDDVDLFLEAMCNPPLAAIKDHEGKFLIAFGYPPKI